MDSARHHIRQLIKIFYSCILLLFAAYLLTSTVIYGINVHTPSNYEQIFVKQVANKTNYIFNYQEKECETHTEIIYNGHSIKDRYLDNINNTECINQFEIMQHTPRTHTFYYYPHENITLSTDSYKKMNCIAFGDDISCTLFTLFVIIIIGMVILVIAGIICLVGGLLCKSWYHIGEIRRLRFIRYNIISNIDE